MSAPRTAQDPFFARIVVALDASGQGDHAALAAKQLAERTGARLSIVHAVGSSSMDWELRENPRDVASDTGPLARAWRATLRHVRELVGTHAPDGRPIEEVLRVRAGRPANVILAEAREQDADLIVIGYDLERSRFDFGSTVRGVIAGAPKAVWIQKHAPTEVKRILVPVDLSPDSLLALHAACSLARMFGARVHALNVFTSAGYVLSTWPDYPDLGAFMALDEIREQKRVEFERAMAAFEWDGVEHSIEFAVGDPAQRIADAQRNVDLIVLGTHGKTALASALLGSVAWHVVRHSHRPIVAIRHPEREFVHDRPARKSAQPSV